MGTINFICKETYKFDKSEFGSSVGVSFKQLSHLIGLSPGYTSIIKIEEQSRTIFTIDYLITARNDLFNDGTTFEFEYYRDCTSVGKEIKQYDVLEGVKIKKPV
jgi:hypothetical protein